MDSDGEARQQLGGQPERSEQPLHRVGLGEGAEDAARAGTARTDEDVDGEHAAETLRWPRKGAGVTGGVVVWRERDNAQSVADWVRR